MANNTPQPLPDSVTITVRDTGSTYYAKPDGRKERATCTMGASYAVAACAAKIYGRDNFELTLIGSGIWRAARKEEPNA